MDIWKISKETTSLPLDDMKQLFMESMHTGRCDCERYFFDGGFGSDYTLNGRNWTDDRDRFLVSYLAWHITDVSSYGFNKVFDRNTSHKMWKDWIVGRSTSLGIDFFFQLKRKNDGWDNIMSNREYWLSEVRDKMCDPTFVLGEEINYFVAQPNYLPLKILFLAVSEVDDDGQSTLHQLEEAFEANLSTEHWNAVKTWKDLNLFDGMESALEVPMFSSQVHSACTKYEKNQTDFGLQEWWGREVASWAIQDYYDLPKLRTGQNPDNYKVV
eukprot:CAMPEP_0115009066 /NCGR_PEP_ID=MMETSP0216-20121206/22356_1 /TAXON_ID=223996 /ORGANISM="Protocruzia adherens, Strain Boccale" /LENGTH=269 /DNA_ID=CAMNT_0002376733 /DNA_START=592 /DNA_END=1401 /DNA_ORIENTATION=-